MIDQEAQSVRFPFVRPRPEKWRAEPAAMVSAPTRTVSHQSSSTMRDAGTPHRSRWAPTPSGMMNGTFSCVTLRTSVPIEYMSR